MKSPARYFEHGPYLLPNLLRLRAELAVRSPASYGSVDLVEDVKRGPLSSTSDMKFSTRILSGGKVVYGGVRTPSAGFRREAVFSSTTFDGT